MNTNGKDVNGEERPRESRVWGLGPEDEEALRKLQAHFESLFPKTCPTCGRVYDSLLDYILNTERVGGAVSYDVELKAWQTNNPLGAVAMSNCSCGTTLAVTTQGVPLSDIHFFLDWVKRETERKKVTPKELLSAVRDEIRRRTLEAGGATTVERT